MYMYIYIYTYIYVYIYMYMYVYIYVYAYVYVYIYLLGVKALTYIPSGQVNLFLNPSCFFCLIRRCRYTVLSRARGRATGVGRATGSTSS